MSIPRVICVMGIDGSGKTTAVEWLAQRLRKHNYDVDVQWLRFNHLLSKPLLAFCRLAGFTRYETINGIRVGYHDFHRSRIVSWLFILFQYLDALRVRYFRIARGLGKKDRILILDRFIPDILIDLMVDTGIKDLDQHPMGKAFLKLMPEECRIIPLLRDRKELLAARPESVVDRNFSVRLELYEQLPGRLGLEPVINNKGLRELLQQVAAKAGIEE